ncbi:hypothetical protein PRIPAC_93413 [Pristionchus pacificus]|uniref:Uncharacterized protein n=1 Tax=Pristionchus pacificus TaxID=54126 RepID=A0A2A6CE29_PRIPA|nr:hypothetical protein PRIPAC_93413 [Pristionchus pacificus]|eukprot:PDM76366.1 hypothetical protein PRIPAC_39970 [Pristionchus pacificus]
MNILLFWAIALLLLPLFLTTALMHSGECFFGFLGLNFVVLFAFLHVFNGAAKMGVKNSSLWSRVCAVSSFWLVAVLLSPYFLIVNMSFGFCFYSFAAASMAITLAYPPQMKCTL